MWQSFCNLLSRVWSNLVSALGTTTLSILLFSFAIPVLIFIAKLILNYNEHKKEGIAMIQLIKDSLFSYGTIIPSAIYLLALILLFFWGLTSTIYKDHNLLKEQIKTCEKFILDKDIEIKFLNKKLNNAISLADSQKEKEQKKKTA